MIFLDSEFIDRKCTWLLKKENLAYTLYFFFKINLSILEGIWWIGRIWRKKPWNLYSMPAYDYYSEAEVTLIEVSFIWLAFSQKPVTKLTVHFEARNSRIPYFRKGITTPYDNKIIYFVTKLTEISWILRQHNITEYTKITTIDEITKEALVWMGRKRKPTE